MVEVPSIIEHLTRNQETVAFTFKALQTLQDEFLNLAMTFAEFYELNYKILERQMTDRAHFENEEFALRHRLAREMRQLLGSLGDFKRDEGRPGIEYRRSFIHYGKYMLFSGDLLTLLDDESYEMNSAFYTAINAFYNEIELIQKRIAARMLTLDKMAEALAGTRLAGHRAANLAVRHCAGSNLYPDAFFGDFSTYSRFLHNMRMKMTKNNEVFSINSAFALYLTELSETPCFPPFGPMGFEYGDLSAEYINYIVGKKYFALDGTKPSQLCKQLVVTYFSRVLTQRYAFFTFGDAKETLSHAAVALGRRCHLIDANCAFTLAEFV